MVDVDQQQQRHQQDLLIGTYFLELWRQNSRASMTSDAQRKGENEDMEDDPTELDTVNSSGGFSVVFPDKLTVQYPSVNLHGHDVGVVQANKPAPVRRLVYYFEEMSGRSSRTIYVGNLPLDVRESEIEDLFYKYGRILDIELKLPVRPPGYCFVEFEDAWAAEDAIRGRDGYDFDGCRLRVELAHGGRGRSSPIDRRGAYGGGGGGRYGVSRRSDYRVVVRGLPSKASWQDLKDHMRAAGDVCFAQVFRDGDGAMGIVDYTNYEDMRYAIRKLDDTEFRNPFGRSYIRVIAFVMVSGARNLLYCVSSLERFHFA
ncbi:hypothetical protein RJ640_008856 [Escallonia rubra]|uniref:RRM domain-containing protein n=1 Tax=Escallonia rubra TaxID=112253 RepID=A0AA88U1Q1_9ASTE|nr:hypothetical protein RJ640_008856 [Escallonia rubra]